jgi:hypothetical protein
MYDTKYKIGIREGRVKNSRVDQDLSEQKMTALF